MSVIAESVDKSKQVRHSNLRNFIAENAPRQIVKKKKLLRESNERFVIKTFTQGKGWNEWPTNDINDLKNMSDNGITYWEVLDNSKGNFSEPDSLIAWGGDGGYWARLAEDEDTNPRLKQYILSKKKDIMPGQGGTNEGKVRLAVRNVIREMVNEDWYPDSDDDIEDYYFGVIMTFQIDGVEKDDLTTDQIEELTSINADHGGDESNMIEDEYKYPTGIVRKVNITPDEFGDYDVTIEVAVDAPDMPTDAVEEDMTDMVWSWAEEKLGVRSPSVKIIDEKVIYDRREKNGKNKYDTI